MTTEGVFAERVSGDVHSSSENSRLHNGNENHFNPYFLSNGDSPGIALVSQHLVGSENYNTWEISMTVALDAKMKYGFVNGEIQMPAIVDSSYSSWKRVNSMVISWILNSVSKEIASSIIYMKSACEIWNDLKERFSEKNNPRIFQLKKAICGLNQDQMSVNSYFTKLKILWEEYSNYSIVPHCSNGSACAALKMMLDFQQKEYTMQFLMGLNDSYANLRSQILLNDPLPQINKVFASIIQEERQRNLSPLVNQVIEPVAYVSKLENGRNVGNPPTFKNGFKRDKPTCTFCHLQGHVVDKCYKLHGYPPGYKSKGKNGSQGYGNSGNNSANQFQAASVQSNMSQGYQMQPTFSQGAQYSSSQNASDEAPVTQGQFQQLMALINNQFGSSNLVQNSPSLAQNSFSASACSSNDFSPFPYPQMTATQSQNSFPVPNKSSAQNQIPTIHNLSGNFFSILACLSALDNHSKPSKPYWIIDTGATNHMACSINFFHYATPVSNMSVKLPNGFIVPVTHDLIHWRMIGLGKRHGGLYILDQVSSKFSQSAHASVSFNASVSSEIWHYRLGHPSHVKLQILQNSIPSLRIWTGISLHHSLMAISKMARKRFSHLVSLLIFSFFHLDEATDTIKPGQSISHSETIISAGGKFELGFFSPGKSRNYFLGIWYKKIIGQTVAWVANREQPLTSPSSILTVNMEGNLVVLDGNNSYPVSELLSIKNTSATLMDSGNLILRDSKSQILWQSFDYPSDTFLPGMKIGYNKKNGKAWSLTSWRSEEDPAPGVFSLKMDPENSQRLIVTKGSKMYWTSGTWNGHIFSQIPEMRLVNSILNFIYVTNQNESYLTYDIYGTSIISRCVMDFTGQFKLQSWFENTQSWNLLWMQPKQQCKVYTICGAFGRCSENTLPFCECMPGFEPRSSRDWNLSDWSGGCKRITRLQCGNNTPINAEKDKFLLRPRMRLPVMPQSLAVGSAEDCKLACMNNCSCTAYAYGSVGCSIWVGDLLNLQEFSNYESAGSNLYLRLAASESFFSRSRGNKRKRMLWAIVAGAVAGAVALTVLLLASFIWCQRMRKLKQKGDVGTGQDLLSFDMGASNAPTKSEASNENKLRKVKKDAGLPLFSFASVTKTKNFQAWELWKNDRALELMDPILSLPSSTSMVLRYINVGLLCVQEYAADRPTMSDVVSVLSNELTPLPIPKQPAFSAGRSVIDANLHSKGSGTCSVNEVTISLMEAR
ncbi:hypothetical protein HHK36_005486 [Tetracentron sinense]|uniref:Uncharacterized protein n=1 Tax=Tetracentron sinense TaxID=13715 RepID=A0A834ZPH7_TETSI|nr:hypothetical protein HHK36_005486 [Tetracentron sinense]